MKKSVLIGFCATALLTISATTLTTVHAESQPPAMTETNMATSTWGTAKATFDTKTGTLRVEQGVIYDAAALSEAERNSEFVDTDQKIARKEVKHLLFGENVSVKNSQSAWQLDGTATSLAQFKEEFAHFDQLTFILGELGNPNMPYPAPFAHGFTHDVYRAYNPNSGDHLYTMSKNEFDHVVDKGWKDEAVAYLAYDWSTLPIYRVYNPNSGEHMFTTSPEEYLALYEATWVPEGISFGAAEQTADTQAVYRAFNPNAKGPGSHLFTNNASEIQHLVKVGWKDEGTAYFVPTVAYTTEDQN
ncbi:MULTISPECIES: hypothetical protein [Enterococcus]|uniref:DUF5648 domain-containing protein n=1 Tax=Enterococcus sulfureus ATCC 49903 TaxID=1140003 RepID=S0L648_9ENTE|nr:hypothetical protein [Enterococcus sulfureus]EOT46941.1 hypothetical protein OMY_01191 [Enterococcus sulfureus ATCC 49903]EOT83764.1 hypothetical protein I573_01489 [Enterococcus sulfureus ATCC 49903]